MIGNSRNLWPGLAFDGAITLVALAVVLLAGFPFGPVLLAALALGSFAIRSLGHALVPHADGRPAALSMHFIVGFAAFSMTMMAIVLLLPLTASSAFLICIPLIAMLWFYRRPALFVMGSAPWFEPALVVVLGVAAAWLCRLQVSAYPTLLQSGVFHPWADFFVHGAQVAQFGDPVAVNHGDILAAGRPLALYHYGMFMLPAALLAVPGAPPALALATSALLVFGLLVAIIGCYALAAELGGGIAALVAVAAVMLLPDAAALWPGNGSFGFHWLMMIAPGSGYAVGVSAVALVYLMRWQQQRRLADALLCLLLVLSVAFLRAQLFVVLATACLLVALYTRYRMRARQMSACLFAVMLLVVVASMFPGPFADWFQLRTRFSEFIGFAFLLPLPDALAEPYGSLVRVLGSTGASWVGLLLLPLLVLGPWIILTPLTAFYLGRRGLLCKSDLMPLMLMLAYLGVVIFAPTPSNGDFTEFKQRPFVLIYAIWLLWPIARLLGLFVPDLLSRSRLSFATLALAMFCAIATLAALLAGHDPQANPAPWTNKYFDTHLPSGLVDVAAFVRPRARPGDVMASVGGCADQSVALASLSGVPQYLAEGGVQWSRRDHQAPSEDYHATTMHAIESSHAISDLAPLLEHAHITWLVVVAAGPGCEKRGPEIEAPVFRSQRVAVFAPAR